MITAKCHWGKTQPKSAPAWKLQDTPAFGAVVPGQDLGYRLPLRWPSQGELSAMLVRGLAVLRRHLLLPRRSSPRRALRLTGCLAIDPQVSDGRGNIGRCLSSGVRQADELSGGVVDAEAEGFAQF